MDFAELKKYLNEVYAPAFERWRGRNTYFHDDILRFFRYAVPQNARVLGIGFNDGWLVDAVKPQRGVYVGMSEVLNRQGAARYPKLHFVDDQSPDRLPLNETFDAIIVLNSIGLVPDIQPFLQRLHQVAAPRTRIFISYYNYLWEPIIKLAERLGLKQRQPVQNWLSSADIANLFDLAGFEVIRTGSRLLLPVYVPLLSAFCNRVLARLPLINRLNFWNYVIVRPRPNYQPDQPYAVSVVVPARNERGNIKHIVERLPLMGSATELIFIEGGSSDGTLEEIKQVASTPQPSRNPTIRYAVQEGIGKGDAVRKGFSLATGDILMILDADLTVRPEELPRFYEVMAGGHAEYVQGSRLIYPMRKEAMRFLNILGNKFFSLVFSWLLGQRFKDTLCGAKVLFRSDYERLANQRHYFGDFDPFGDFDLIFGASRLSLKMTEIPVHYQERSYGSTNISRFRHGLLLLRMCLFAARKLE